MWHFIDGRGGWLSLAILKPPLNLSKRAPKIILPEKFMPNSKQKGFTKMNEFEETFFMIFDRLILKFSRAWFSQIWRSLGRGMHCIQQWCNMFRIFWIINFYFSDIKRGTKVKKPPNYFTVTGTSLVFYSLGDAKKIMISLTLSKFEFQQVGQWPLKIQNPTCLYFSHARVMVSQHGSA